MADYSADVASARDLITESGTVVTVRRVTAGSAYNPVTDTVTGSSVVTFTVAAVFLPSLTSNVRDRAMAREEAIRSDQSLMLMAAVTTDGSALAFAPLPGDIVVTGTPDNTPSTSWWKIDSVGPLEPNLTPILYTLIVTRGMGGV